MHVLGRAQRVAEQSHPPTTTTVASSSARRPRLLLARESIGVMVGQPAADAGWFAGRRLAPCAGRRRVGVLAATLVAMAVLAVGAAAPVGRVARSLAGADRVRERPRRSSTRARSTRSRSASRRATSRTAWRPTTAWRWRPVGDQIAFWSGRSGHGRASISRAPTGSRLRLVRGLAASAAPGRFRAGRPAAPSRPTARRLVRGALQASHQRRLRRSTCDARPPARSGVAAACSRPSPDGKLVACGVQRKTTVPDLAGHLRFTLPCSRRDLVEPRLADGRARPRARRARPRSSIATGRTVARVNGAAGRVVARRRARCCSDAATRCWVGDPRDLGRARDRSCRAGLAARCVVHARRPLRLDRRQRGQADARAAWRAVAPIPASPSAAASGHATAGWRTSGTRASRPRCGRASRSPSSSPTAHGQQSARGRALPLRRSRRQRPATGLPDGKRLLFLTVNDVQRQRPLRRPSGRRRHAVQLDARSARSRDTRLVAATARRIAYAACRTSPATSETGLPTHIATVQRRTASGAQRVTDDGGPNEGSFDGDPSFSPDGTPHRVRPRHVQRQAPCRSSPRAAVCARRSCRRGRAHPRAWRGRRMAPRIAFVSAGASIMVVRRERRRARASSRRSCARKFCGCGGPGLVARRHADRRRRRRRHLPDRRSSRSRASQLAIARALRRVPVVLTRRDPDRVRRARRAPARRRRRRSWPPTSTARTSAPSARCRSGRACIRPGSRPDRPKTEAWRPAQAAGRHAVALHP